MACEAQDLADRIEAHLPRGKQFSYVTFAEKFYKVFPADLVTTLKVDRQFYRTGKFSVSYGMVVDMNYTYNYFSGNIER